jgi:hypothetical protein
MSIMKTVNTVSVDGTAVYSNSFTSVVDTGTTLVYLPETCYKDIVKYFQSHHSNPFWNSSVRTFVILHTIIIMIFI